MERRDFLKVGSAAAAGPALWPAKGFCATGEEAAPFISVGYLSPESDCGGHSGGGCWTPVPRTITRSENLSRGERELAKEGCRVTVHGLFPSPAAAEQNGLLTLSLEVSYEPFQPVWYRAWSYENVLAPNISHGSSFHVPITNEHGLTLGLFLRRALNGSLVETEHAVRLSPGTERGVPKLRQGTYFLGIHADASFREGRWERYEVADPGAESSEEDRWAVTARSFPGFELKPVTFPYLVLSIVSGGEEEEEMA
jgi:hypothetical protein